MIARSTTCYNTLHTQINIQQSTVRRRYPVIFCVVGIRNQILVGVVYWIRHTQQFTIFYIRCIDTSYGIHIMASGITMVGIYGGHAKHIMRYFNARYTSLGLGYYKKVKYTTINHTCYE